MPTTQAEISAQVHTAKEIEKWRGMCQPVDKQARLRNPSTKITYVHELLVIANLLVNNVKLIPSTIELFLWWGPVMEHYAFGYVCKDFDFPPYSFGKQKGSKNSAQMSYSSMTDPYICGIFHKAEVSWYQSHGTKPFRSTY
eukprot:6973570-Ditylum_brightwellii.AAC.1